MKEINWSSKEEVLEYLRNGGQELQKIDESLLGDWSFVREAGRIEPYIFEMIDVNLQYDHSDEMREILEELKAKEGERAAQEIEKRIIAKEEFKKKGSQYIKSQVIHIAGESFLTSDIIEMFEKEDLQDLEDIETYMTIKTLLGCFTIYDFRNVYDNEFVGSIDNPEIELPTFELFEKLGDSKLYIDFVEKLIEIHGKDVVMREFGDLIREKVPNYAFKLDGLNLETQEGTDFLIDMYPEGYARRHISIDRVYEELDKRKAEYNRYFAEGAEGAELGKIVEHFYKRGEEIPEDMYERNGVATAVVEYCIKNGLDFPNSAVEIVIWEDEGIVEKVAISCIENGHEIPQEIVEFLGEEKIQRLKDEAQLRKLQEKDRKVDEALALAERLYREKKDKTPTSDE